MVGDIGESMHSLLEVSNGGTGASHVPAFLAKLWKIVDDPNTDELICWSEMGNSFLIRNQSKFARELLPLYYKHNNMASFVRQLNMYGFHKVVSVDQGGLRTDKDEMEFAHPFFLRGSESTLELIKRKIPAAKLDDTRGARPDTINKVLLDVRQMKGRQDSLDTKLLNVKRENEALWRELSILRQKHAKQQQIVSKLLQFLVGMMSSQSHRLGFKRRMHMSHVPLMLNDTDGLKSNKRNKNSGGELVGPVIRDVTEYINSSNRMLEDQSEYQNQGSPIDSEIHPKVDSPPSTSGRSPYSESIYPMSPYDDPDMLLSVDPLAINPSMDIKHPISRSGEIPTTAATSPPPKKNNKLQTNKIKASKVTENQGSSKKATSTAMLNEANYLLDTTAASNSQQANNVTGTDLQDKQLPTIMYIPGVDTPIQVVLSIPETQAGSSTATSGSVLNQAVVTDSIVPFTNTTTTTSRNQPNLVSISSVDTKSSPSTSSSTSVPSDTIQIQVPSIKVQNPKSKNTATTISTMDSESASPLNEMILSSSSSDGLVSRQDFDGHLDDVQSGLDNLRELLKQDQYSIDQNTLMSLFGSDSDILDLYPNIMDNNPVKDGQQLSAGNSAVGLDLSFVDGFINFEKGSMVAYNPSLYELADDDSQFFDSSEAFLEDQRSLPSTLLDDELQSMLTTDREKLRSIGDVKTNEDIFSTTS